MSFLSDSGKSLIQTGNSNCIIH